MPRKPLKRQTIPVDKLEEFRIVPGFPDYAASRDGRVFSVKRPSRGFYPLKPKSDKDGYHNLVLRNENGRSCLREHRIVAMAWIGIPESGLVVNHKNGIKTDNRPENLEWVTPADNERHSRRVLGKKCYGERSPRRKLTIAQVLEIRKLDGIETQASIANRFNVGQAQIWRILRKKNWPHI